MAEGLEMGKDPNDPTHSRTLFVREDGTSISFYVRPGPAKRRLSTLILHGGGTLCRVQEPEAVLLAQPGEAQAEALGDFISTQYVTDCVERNERLALEDYRLGRREPESPEAAPREPEEAYTEAEDAAIVRYVKDNARSPSALAGTALWKGLEKAALTQRPWQSLKERYLKHLKGLEQKYLEAEVSPAQKPKRKAEEAEPDGSGKGRFYRTRTRSPKRLPPGRLLPLASRDLFWSRVVRRPSFSTPLPLVSAAPSPKPRQRLPQ